MNLDHFVTIGLVVAAIFFLIFKFRSKSKTGCGKSCGCAVERKPVTGLKKESSTTLGRN